MVQKQIAVFGGGCFWCTEAVFSRLRGVISVIPGYAGGTVPHPTYEQVCMGKTGHAEVIKVEFNEREIGYEDLLTVFFATHNPTTRNRQGNDVGTQYRSVIFYADSVQKQKAEEYIKRLHNSTGTKIVTEIEPLDTFWPAEVYHREYYAKNKDSNAYCAVIIRPKLDKLHTQFSHLLKMQRENLP